MSQPDLTNVVFFPKPTVEQLSEQKQKVEDLLEEARIYQKIGNKPSEEKRIATLEKRCSDIYEEMVAITRDDIVNLLNSA